MPSAIAEYFASPTVTCGARQHEDLCGLRIAGKSIVGPDHQDHRDSQAWRAKLGAWVEGHRGVVCAR